MVRNTLISFLVIALIYELPLVAVLLFLLITLLLYEMQELYRDWKDYEEEFE